MERKGQGAIEYLLIIGAAILVVAIVIIAVTGVLGTTNDRGETASADQLKAQERMDLDGPIISFSATTPAPIVCTIAGVAPNINLTGIAIPASRVVVTDTLSNLKSCTFTVRSVRPSGPGNSTVITQNAPANSQTWTIPAIANILAGNILRSTVDKTTIEITCYDQYDNSSTTGEIPLPAPPHTSCSE